MNRAFKIITNVIFALLIVIGAMLLLSYLPMPNNFRTLVVETGSMEPTIKTGSVVVVSKASSYQTGDIITFQDSARSKTSITHRIKEVKDGQFVTQGDANQSADFNKVSSANIIGKVRFWIPYLGYVLAFVRTRLGIVLVIAIPAAVIIVDQIWKIRNEIKSLKAKKKVLENPIEKDTDA